MIKNEVVEELETLVPPGQRSKLVNEALIKELALFRRHIQTERLMKLRQKSPKLSTNEMVSTLRDDRQRR